MKYFRLIGLAAMVMLLTACATKVEHYTSPVNKKMNFPFSEAVKVGNTVYLSGQIGVIMGTGKLVKGGIEAETEQMLKNIGSTLKHYSLSFKDIYKCTVMLAEIKEWKKFNKVYRKYIPAPYPARSAYGTSGLALNARVELECMALAK